MSETYLPILMQLGVACSFAVSALIVSVLLGKSASSNAVKDSAYECGMLPIGNAQPRFSVKFYLVAMLFVLFDIEVVFMYPWAIVFKELIATDVMPVTLGMGGFVLILFVAYLYVLKKGALQWND